MSVTTIHETDKRFLRKIRLEKDDPTVFDVGANIGDFSREVLKIWPLAKITAFEPNPYAYSELLGVQVKAYNCALSDEDAITTLYYDDSADLTSSLYKRDLSYQYQPFGTKQCNVQVKKLSQFDFTEIDLLKIDAEGSELDILLGAGQELTPSVIKNIYFEFNSCNLDSRTFFKDFWDLLTYRSYSIFLLEGDLNFTEIDKYHTDLEDFTAHRDFLATNGKR